MSDRAPLERLDDAVHDFHAALVDLGEEDGALAGWALVYQTQYLDSDKDPSLVSPVEWDAGYAISPGASPFMVIGLLDHLRATITAVFAAVHDDDDDEEEP